MLAPTTSSKVELEVLLSTAATSATTTSEELIENVVMIKPPEVSIRILALCVSLQSLFSMLVIHTFLIWIRKSLIGICNSLEFLFRTLWIILVLVRMIFYGHFLESFFYLIVSGTPLETQNLIVILLLCACQGAGENKET